VPKLRSAVYALKAIEGSATRYGAHYATLTRRFVHLYRRRFSPYEIYFNDLLNPRISEAALENYISKEEQIAADRKHTLETYLCVTADKAVFYAVCLAAGLPTPKLLAVFDQPAGWIPDGRVLLSRSDWCAFMQSLPSEFVVKPALGLLGKGLAMFRRDGEEFVDSDGRRHTAEQLYEFLCSEKQQNLFTTSFSHHSLLSRDSHKVVVQERLYAHPEIAELTGSAGLSTCRLVTHRDSAGIHVLGSVFRAIGGKNLFDNFDQGRAGNLWCRVDPESGRIVEAIGRAAGADRLESMPRHPATLREVVGFRIPRWGEAMDLACHLANIFYPQTLIHWDIGITLQGAMVVEGNIGGSLLPTPLNVPARTLLTDG
jgi:hypothetical protein